MNKKIRKKWNRHHMSEKFKQYAFKSNTLNPNTHKLFPTFPIIFNSKHNKLFDASISLLFFSSSFYFFEPYAIMFHVHIVIKMCVFFMSEHRQHHQHIIHQSSSKMHSFFFLLIFYVTHWLYYSMLYAPITKMQARTTNWKICHEFCVCEKIDVMDSLELSMLQ